MEPKWLEEAAAIDYAPNHGHEDDHGGTVAMLLAHIRELREALGLALNQWNPFNDLEEEHAASCRTILTRQEPPEVK